MVGATERQDWVRTELCKYLYLQRALVEQLRAQISGEPFEVHVPRQGIVEMDGVSWTFVRHGAGVTFRESGTSVIVNVAEELGDPTLFDVGRLRGYFGSMGPRVARKIARTTNREAQPLERALHAVVARLEEEGFVTRVGRYFRIA